MIFVLLSYPYSSFIYRYNLKFVVKTPAESVQGDVAASEATEDAASVSDVNSVTAEEEDGEAAEPGTTTRRSRLHVENSEDVSFVEALEDLDLSDPLTMEIYSHLLQRDGDKSEDEDGSVTSSRGSFRNCLYQIPS